MRQGASSAVEGPSPSCLNCGGPLGGSFCSACGQAADARGGVRLRSLLRDFLADLTSMESAHLRTFRGLLSNPGRVAREWVVGRRVAYAGPVRWYLLAFAFSVLMGGLTSAAIDRAAESTGENFLDTSFVALQLAVVFMLILVPLALAYRLLFRRAGWTTTEQFVFLLYVLGQSTLLQALIEPLYVLATLAVDRSAAGYSSDVEGVLWLVLVTGYLVLGGAEFQREPRWRVALKTLAAYAGMLLVMTLVGLLLQAIGIP